MKSQVNDQWSQKFENVSTIEKCLQPNCSDVTYVSSFIPGAYFAPALGAAKSVYPKLPTRDSHIVWWLLLYWAGYYFLYASKWQNDVASQLPKMPRMIQPNSYYKWLI